MINTLQEIQDRFEKIKDHKPKASKKLNELGDILASAYRISSELADEMWQYIVDLNVDDDIANAKFYVAQVFNKISDRLSPEEATRLISMNPDRVRLMVLYGYDGFKLWDCLDTLVRGYIQINAADDAIICVEYFYEKFDGINSDRTEVYRVARKAASICVEYMQNGEFSEEAERLIDLLCSSENQDVNSIVEITKIVATSGVCDDYDMLFYVAKKCKEPVEFFDLLWAAREQFSSDELREKWVEYVETCEENDTRPYNYVREDDPEATVSYEESKLRFYVDMEKNEDALLDYYFSRPQLYDVEKGVVCAWVFDDNWDYFVKYISQSIMASSDESLDWTIKNQLKEFMDACFFGSGVDSHDRYGRSYKELMKTRASSFAEALAQISAITVGCNCHRGYHLFIKGFIQVLNGNVEILKDVGFEDKVEKRSAVEQAKEYIKKFNQSGKKIHEKRNTEFSLIMDKFASGIFDKKQINKARNEAYRMASDDMIATFFFTQCPGEYQRRKDMLAACVIKNDIDRAIVLIDMMASTKENKGYNDRNGWGRQNMLTIKYLIQLFDYSKQHIIGEEANGITDSMRQAVKQLVDRAMPSLPQKSQEELVGDLHKIEPPKSKERSNSFDTYIDKLLNDVDAYTTYLKTKTRERSFDINKVNWNIGESFKKLSSAGRVDVIINIMQKLSSVHDSLLGVTYHFHILDMVKGITGNDFSTLFNYNSEIFETWLNNSNLTEKQILDVAAVLGKSCSSADFTSFCNMVIIHKGYIDGLDDCFEVTSENTKNQVLFNGASVKIELDYIEIYDDRAKKKDDLIDIELHLLTTKKTNKISSVRVASFKINENDFMDEFGWWEFDDEPRIGYKLDGEKSNNELTITEGHLKERGVHKVDRIEMQMIAKYGRKVLEYSPAIILEYDDRSGGYIVRTDAKKENGR